MTRILLTGRNGQVGWELRRALMPLGEIVATDREEMDLADPDAMGRITLFPGFGQRDAKPNVPAATREYVRIAKEARLTPAVMALAFARTRWFTRSVLLGATSLQQLQENLGSAEIVLSAEALEKIEAVHKLFPNPAP